VNPGPVSPGPVNSYSDGFPELRDAVLDTLAAGGTLFLAGNGGSASTASGVTAALVLAERWLRAPFPAVDLSADAALWSGAAAGWGAEEGFVRGLEALARPGDFLLLFSPTGTPQNLLGAARWAQSKGIQTGALLAGGGGPLKGAVTFPVVVPTSDPFRAREAHLALGHALVEGAEARFVEPIHRALESAVEAEIGRTTLYRRLSAALLDAGDDLALEAVNELLADEQHHRARVAARLMELGVTPNSTGMEAIPEARASAAPLTLPDDLSAWRTHVVQWEAEEVARYEALLTHRFMDREIRELLEEILASERHHHEAQKGKWMSA
jgi:D-sedoheptulose 7-phosphate isomerase